MSKQTPRYVDIADSLVNAPGSSYFDVEAAWAHIGNMTMRIVGGRNRAYDRENAYVKFEAGSGARKCWVVVKLEPTDEYSLEFHRFEAKPFRKVKGEMVINENFGRVKVFARHDRIPLENLREIIRDHFTA